MITDLLTLRQHANHIRCRDLEIIHRAGLGHAGGDLSSADILTTLYFGVLHIDPTNPRDPNRDRFILSKGHGAGLLYTMLAEAGFFPPEQDSIPSWRHCAKLNGHPDRNKVPGVETNTGPLGHGFPVGVGAALAAKLQHASWRTFVVTGDGELQEGSMWEAAMAAAHYGLDNLTMIVDRNGLQQGDTTERTMHLEPLVDKFRSFGWAVREVDGHDYTALLQLFATLPFEPGQPNCVIAHTHKGQGVSFMRDRVEWHHKVPNRMRLERALRELSEVSDGPAL